MGQYGYEEDWLVYLNHSNKFLLFFIIVVVRNRRRSVVIATKLRVLALISAWKRSQRKTNAYLRKHLPP